MNIQVSKKALTGLLIALMMEAPAVTFAANKQLLLFEAATNGNKEYVEHLLKTSASKYSLHTNFGSLAQTLLHIAATNGHTQVISLLIHHGAKIDSINNHNETPLHLAVIGGHTTAVQTLLTLGALPNARDRSGDTPLHCAARSGHNAIIQILIDSGADIDSTNNFLNTPLHSAASKGIPSTVELLLKLGSNVDAEGKDRETTLLSTVRFLSRHTWSFPNHEREKFEQAICLLVKRGARVTQKTVSLLQQPGQYQLLNLLVKIRQKYQEAITTFCQQLQAKYEIPTDIINLIIKSNGNQKTSAMIE